MLGLRFGGEKPVTKEENRIQDRRKNKEPFVFYAKDRRKKKRKNG